MKRTTLLVCCCAVLGVALLVGYLAGTFLHQRPQRASQMLSALPDLHRFPRAKEERSIPLVAEVARDLKGWAGRSMPLGETAQGLPENLQRIVWKQLAGPGKVKFQPPDHLETKATFDQPGDYLLRLTAMDGQREVSRDIAAHVLAAPFDLWKQKRFSTASVKNPAGMGDLADPDRDGISNLTEYALMLDPQRSDVGGLPDPSLRKGKVLLTYRRPASAVDVEYQVQWSDDMQTWHDDGIEEQILVSVGDLQVIQASALQPPGQQGRFLRLQIRGPQQ